MLTPCQSTLIDPTGRWLRTRSSLALSARSILNNTGLRKRRLSSLPVKLTAVLLCMFIPGQICMTLMFYNLNVMFLVLASIVMGCNNIFRSGYMAKSENKWWKYMESGGLTTDQQALITAKLMWCLPSMCTMLPWVMNTRNGKGLIPFLSLLAHSHYILDTDKLFNLLVVHGHT